MEDENRREFVEIRFRVLDHLRRRLHILQPKHKPLLQYLTIPSFDDAVCIGVVSTNGGLSVYRTVWRMTQDAAAVLSPMERLRHPHPYEPSVNSERLTVSIATIEALLAKLQSSQFPPVELRRIYLDGVSYELSLGDGDEETHIRWTNELPQEWSLMAKSLQTLAGMAGICSG
jgi:hypothetical protein